MRAMLLDRNAAIKTHPLREVSIADPVPGPGEILVRGKADRIDGSAVLLLR